MSENSGEIETNLLRELECPVCFDHMQPPITICENGHSICSICKPNLYRCPSCRKSLLEIRNLALENLARSLTYPCPNAKAGCTAILFIHDLPNHQNMCLYTCFQCPFSKISNLPCGWNSPIENLKKHILREHRRTSVEIYGGGKFFSHLANLTSETTLSKALVVFGEVFYAVWKACEEGFYCTVLYVGPKAKASKYVYKLTLSKQNKPDIISCSSMTNSYLDDVEDILKPGRCIALHYRTVQAFFAGINKLPFELEISKILDPEQEMDHFENDLFD